MATRTELGRELRAIRARRDETLKDMADALEISVAYLSSIEHARRPVPADFVLSVSRAYDLTKEESDRLAKAAIRSREVFKVRAETGAQREVGALLEANLTRMSPDQVTRLREQMRRILDNGK